MDITRYNKRAMALVIPTTTGADRTVVRIIAFGQILAIFP
jgi:hypothetical protein